MSHGTLYSGEKNAKAWIVYYQLTEAIQPDTLAWVEGEPINMNGSWLPLVNSYVSQMYEVLTLLGNGFLVHAAALLVALLIFIPVAIVYIRMLGQQMNIVTFASVSYESSRKKGAVVCSPLRFLPIAEKIHFGTQTSRYLP